MSVSPQPRPPFDPELAAALAVLGEQVPSSITPEMIPVLRAEGAKRAPAPDEDLTGGAFVEEEHTARGADGTEVPLLVWRPKQATGATGTLYWIHGGGMVAGTHRGREIPGLLEYARELDLALVSVDYRLAPEHPHPAPVEDCYTGLVWWTANAAGFGADPDRLVVGGSSAGGGLAAATCLLARDRGGPSALGQLLLCPMLDDRNDSVSGHQMAGLGVWDRVSNTTGWGALLGERAGGPEVSPYAAPARARDLSGLPPAFLDVGSAETFRDEVVEYASRIWRAGGSAELHVWPGGFHSFDGFAPEAVLSRSAREQRLPWLRRVLAG
ncbi:esterase [Nocardiopsis terrae]|uniref:Acetyl esterase/lipase n=1 Tax=Nocardiopsis terrae TaxID=372655 RepID=A0ABR9HHN0_9ACTN|nr:alpha/beta hydrolase [Nocardiopsis terrae]MBE1458528.1 acetyl esterase/lipase [Nocardiopsis terrae]GHC79910.1 esterase [Nocardiopsis terrae]